MLPYPTLPCPALPLPVAHHSKLDSTIQEPGFKTDADPLNEYIRKMREADAILLGSPTYFADVTPEIKALIDRAGFVLRPQDGLLRKLGAALVTARRGGAIHTFDSLNHFFLINQMIVIGSSYWNDGRGGPLGAVENDDHEGAETARTLGRNMAWALKRLGGEPSV